MAILNICICTCVCVAFCNKESNMHCNYLDIAGSQASRRQGDREETDVGFSVRQDQSCRMLSSLCPQRLVEGRNSLPLI